MNCKKINTKLKQILESSQEDEANKIVYKAQDIALHAGQLVISKLQECIKNGYVEDFFMVLISISNLLKGEKINPQGIIDDIANLADSFVNEQDEDDKKWLSSCIDTKMEKLDFLFNQIKSKLG